MQLSPKKGTIFSAKVQFEYLLRKGIGGGFIDGGKSSRNIFFFFKKFGKGFPYHFIRHKPKEGFSWRRNIAQYRVAINSKNNPIEVLCNEAKLMCCLKKSIFLPLPCGDVEYHTDDERISINHYPSARHHEPA